MPKKSYILSLKYSPGLLKEMLTLAKGSQKEGFEPKLILSSDYRWLLEEFEDNKFDALFFSIWCLMIREEFFLFFLSLFLSGCMQFFFVADLVHHESITKILWHQYENCGFVMDQVHFKFLRKFNQFIYCEGSSVS